MDVKAGDTLLAYTGDRADVIAMITGRPRRILDVGCSDGSLLAALGGDGETVGIELDDALAAAARDRIGTLVQDDALKATADLRAAGREFDLVVCADILEHLVSPEAVMANVAAMLAPDGRCVVSLPNVRFWTTFWELGVRGRWPRRSRGVHDRTHLRWFTHRDAVEMFAAAGLEVERWSRNYRLSDDPMRRGNRLGRLIGHGPIRPFVTYQNLYRLRRREAFAPAGG